MQISCSHHGSRSYSLEGKILDYALSEMKTRRYALSAFSFLSSAAGIGFIGASITGSISVPLAFLAVPLFLGSIVAYAGASQLKFAELLITDPF